MRPLAVGEILDAAISCIRSHPRVMLGFSAIVVALTQTMQLGATWSYFRDVDRLLGASPETLTTQDFAAVAGGLIGGSLVGLVLSTTAQVILTGLLTVVVGRAVLGQSIGVGDAWSQVRPQLWRLFGVAVAVILMIVGGLVAVLAPALILLAASLPGELVAVLAVIGVLVWIPAAVYVYVSFALSTPALVLERQKVWKSLSRSRYLVQGNWWRVFGVLILAFVITSVVTLIVQTPFSLFSGAGSFLAIADGEGLSVVGLVIEGIGGIITGTITYPFLASVGVLLYVDQRMRREGLDLELARAAGVQPPPPGYGPPPSPPPGYGPPPSPPGYGPLQSPPG